MADTTRRTFFGLIAGAAAIAVVPFRVGHAYVRGLVFKFKPTAENTGLSTLDAGYGVQTIRHPDGTPLQAGDIQAGQIVEFHL